MNFSHRRLIIPHTNASMTTTRILSAHENTTERLEPNRCKKGHTSHHWFLILSPFFSGPSCTILNKAYLYKNVVGYKTFFYSS